MNHSLKRFLQNSWFIYKWSKWLYLNKSLNHSLKRFLQNSWFIYKWSKWLCFWMNHWIIDSNDSFKTTDSFTNEASDCVFEWITESLTQTIPSKQLIHLQMKRVTVFEEIIESFTQTILQNNWLIYKWSKWLCFWMNHWIIDSNDSFKTTDSFTNEASDCVFEYIIESFTQTIPSKQLIHLQMKQVTVFE